MALRLPVFLLLLLLSGRLYAQNMVTNPGFEALRKCPNDRSQIYYLPDYRSFPTVLDWVSPLNSSPDYFNTCSSSPEVKLPNLSLDGYHQPHGGNACAGISMFSGHPIRDTADYWAEYLETRLSAPMVAGHTYYVSYYVCPTKHSEQNYNIISVDDLGARLTTHMIDTYCHAPMFFLPGPPDIQTPPGLFITDTKAWTLVSGRYLARGGEQWLTIGRFYTNMLNYKVLSSPVQNTHFDSVASNCYMLVDDVCVIDLDSPQPNEVSVPTPQFPIMIGAENEDGSYEWDNGATTQQIQVTEPGVHTRKRLSGCSYYIDRFTVSEAVVDYCAWLPSAFTPNGDGLNDMFGPGNIYCHPDLTDFQFTIYNRFGQVVFETVAAGERWDGRLGGVSQPVGVYFYTLRYLYAGAFAYKNPPSGTATFIKGDVTLVR